MSEFLRLPEKSLEDKYINSLLFYKLKNNSNLVGTYLNMNNLDDLKNKLLNVDLFKVLELPKVNSLLVRTSEIDIGYKDYISLKEALEFVKIGLLPKDLEIKCVYNYGNVFTYIKKSITELNKKIVLSSDTYLFIEKNTLKIWNIIIGKPSKPNFLYCRKDLNNKVFKLESLKNATKIHRLNLSMGFFDHDDVPF